MSGAEEAIMFIGGGSKQLILETKVKIFFNKLKY